MKIAVTTAALIISSLLVPGESCFSETVGTFSGVYSDGTQFDIPSGTTDITCSISCDSASSAGLNLNVGSMTEFASGCGDSVSIANVDTLGDSTAGVFTNGVAATNLAFTCSCTGASTPTPTMAPATNACLSETVGTSSGTFSGNFGFTVSSGASTVTCTVSCDSASSVTGALTASGSTTDGAGCGHSLTLSGVSGGASASINIIANGYTNLAASCVCDAVAAADDPPPTGTCFSGETQVYAKDVAAPVQMKDLQVGSLVLTGSGEYQAVYAFGHRHTAKPTSFLQIRTSSSSSSVPLEITHEHMVFVDGKKNPVRAGSLKVGDVLQGHQRIDSISQVTRNGLFAPLTADGTILVNDGIVASAYIALQDNDGECVQLKGGIDIPFLSYQTLVHRALSPLRITCSGILSCDDDGMYNEQGYHLYVSHGLGMAEWMDRQWMPLQLIALVLFLLWSSVVMSVESVLTTPGGPFLVLLAAVFCAVRFVGWFGRRTAKDKDDVSMMMKKNL